MPSSSPRTPTSPPFMRRVSTANMAHFGVSTRGGVNQPLACPGVRAHRGPGALGGRWCVLRHAIDATVAGFEAYVHLEHCVGCAVLLQWRRIPHPVIPQEACAERERRRIEDTQWRVGVDHPQGTCRGRYESDHSINNPLYSIIAITKLPTFFMERKVVLLCDPSFPPLTKCSRHTYASNPATVASMA